ncbi:hypothetical protein [Actinokineospora sp. NBRC 105648]|uniref:hypothetical protein n=1 Tax=Actinokineospora sp. NBRC 105648 TaxID=3032206 RepID=UPI0024A2CFC0|nr:hypothetical protein [Actinokineospora sp. NBRC 105648]GLZ39370.1 hypothetical protein Acsp05_29940 [Actinokineospora sp. NBRC 105648]
MVATIAAVPDGDGDEEQQRLCATLSAVSTAITGYVRRDVDAHLGRATPTPPRDEHQLGRVLIALGNRLATRALHRDVTAVWNTYDAGIHRPTGEAP